MASCPGILKVHLSLTWALLPAWHSLTLLSPALSQAAYVLSPYMVSGRSPAVLRDKGMKSTLPALGIPGRESNFSLPWSLACLPLGNSLLQVENKEALASVSLLMQPRTEQMEKLRLVLRQKGFT